MSPSTGRKTLLLAGASGQLGTAILESIGDQLDVIALVNRNRLRTAHSEAALFDLDGREHRLAPIRVVSCDLESQERSIAAIETIAALTPSIDYVIYAAGDARFLGETSDARTLATEGRRQFEVNLFAPAIICSTLFHAKWKNIPVAEQQTSILHISSISGTQLFKDAGQGFYAASKAALNMLTMHMAHEYGRYGIKVNALAPNSFPSIVDTSVVASNALKILTRDATGQIFRIG